MEETPDTDVDTDVEADVDADVDAMIAEGDAALRACVASVEASVWHPALSVEAWHDLFFGTPIRLTHTNMVHANGRGNVISVALNRRYDVLTQLHFEFPCAVEKPVFTFGSCDRAIAAAAVAVVRQPAPHILDIDLRRQPLPIVMFMFTQVRLEVGTDTDTEWPNNMEIGPVAAEGMMLEEERRLQTAIANTYTWGIFLLSRNYTRTGKRWRDARLCARGRIPVFGLA